MSMIILQMTQMMLYLALALLLGLACPTWAVDGVVLVNQSQALAGNVTPGDAPGFPVTLSQPGSYRLSGNLSVPDTETTAIEIISENITLDLNGFAILGLLEGDPSLGGSGTGVDAFEKRAITVINGSVRGMGDNGILLGTESYVDRVTVSQCGRHGIEVGDDSTVINSIAGNNVGSGIIVGNDSVVSENTVNYNGQGGADGIVAGSGSVVSDNIVSHSGGDGIETGDGSTVLGNTALGNGNGEGTTGILTGTGSTVSGNTAKGNRGPGIFAGDGSTVSGNTAESNGGYGGGGIEAGSGSTVSDNTASFNYEDGIVVGSGSTILGNTARGNEDFGIRFSAPTSGYATNVLTENNGGNANPQVSDGGIEIGTNLCGADTSCLSGAGAMVKRRGGSARRTSRFEG